MVQSNVYCFFRIRMDDYFVTTWNEDSSPLPFLDSLRWGDRMHRHQPYCILMLYQEGWIASDNLIEKR